MCVPATIQLGHCLISIWCFAANSQFAQHGKFVVLVNILHLNYSHALQWSLWWWWDTHKVPNAAQLEQQIKVSLRVQHVVKKQITFCQKKETAPSA